MRANLQTWIREIFYSRQGLVSAVGRISLASTHLGVYAFLWFFVLAAVFIAFAASLQRSPSPQETFILLILALGLFALPALHVIRRMTQHFEQRPLVSVGLRPGAYSLREFFSGVALGTILAGSGFLYWYWSGALHITWNPVDLTLSSLLLVLVLTLGWLGVAAWEELYFRGYLLQTWASGIGLIPAVLVTSISFGIIHVTTYGMAPLVFLNIALAGVVLAVLYLKTKSLWAPIGMHFANNFVLVHVLPIPLEKEMQLPLIKINDQPVQFEVPHLLFQSKLAGEKSLISLWNWEALLSILMVQALLILLIWKLPWFRPHPEMEALWRQYVQPAQPWARLREWWQRRQAKAS